MTDPAPSRPRDAGGAEGSVPGIKWVSPDGDLPPVPIGWRGGLRIALRLPPLALTVFGGLALHLALRLIERPLFGLRRPVTPFVTQAVCKAALWFVGLPLSVVGTPLQGCGAVVANHVSWLDIFVLNAPQRIYFVAKAEVAKWPGIGWLARATGTVFVRRDPREAKRQKLLFEARLRAGHHLCFFPEGTNSDGLRVLPFKPTLFAAFFEEALRDALAIQPVSLVYHAPDGADPRFYGWWGDMGFGENLIAMLAQCRHGRVELVFHPVIAVADCASRKDLAQRCEAAVRAGLVAHLPEAAKI